MELNPAILAHAVELHARAIPDRRVLTFDYPDHVEPLTYVELLRGAGFTRVKNLRGGIDAWRAAGLPTTGSDPFPW